MKNILYLLLPLTISVSCHSQSERFQERAVGGRCEGCEALYEYEGQQLISTDTLPAFHQNEPKLRLTGKVLQSDGKTPAGNVIVYIYHTNAKGIYETEGIETGWGKRHGMYRGWIKTNESGTYEFYTFRPASYPKTTIPAHIHMTVKEPTTSAYFVEDFFFDDDPYLTEPFRNGLRKRGGSGISQPKMREGILTIHRDIILGLNIPDY